MDSKVKARSAAQQPSTKDGAESFFQKKEDRTLSSAADKASFFNKPALPVVQPRLEVHPHDDAYEREADRNADTVTGQLHRPGGVQKKPDGTLSPSPAIALSRIQRKRAFESPTGMELNSAHYQDAQGELQSKAEGSSDSEASPGLAARLQQESGKGTALPDSTRNHMESAFGNDFSHVRVHTNPNAVQMSRDLGAQAFTHGNDIYFNEGKYSPGTKQGDHLLAHELTHTVQQSGGVQKSIQKKNDSSAPAEVNFDSDPPTLVIKKIDLPQAKEHVPNPGKLKDLKRPKGQYERSKAYKDVKDESSSKEQRELWKETVKPEVKKVVDSKVQDAEKKNSVDTDPNTKSKIYYLHNKKNKSQKIIGKPETILENSLIPNWSKDGKGTFFDVDHIRELQLGGKNFPNNMELLNFSINRTSGNAVREQIEHEIIEYVNDEKEKAKKNPTGDEKKFPGLNSKFPKNAEDAKKRFDIIFKDTKFGGKPSGTKESFWTYDEITKGNHLDVYEPMPPKEIKDAKGTKEKPLIYTSPAGGASMTKEEIVGYGKGNKNVTYGDFNLEEDTSSKAPDTPVGNFNLEFAVYGSKGVKKSFKVPIYKMEGVTFGGYLPGTAGKGAGGLVQLLTGLEMPGMSPIVIDQAGFMKGKGLVAKGRIISTLEVIKGLEVDFFVEGDDITISKTFSAGEIKVPKPFKINDASMTIFMGTKGFGIRGDVFFEITNVGVGHISGTATTDGKFGITGKFDFDKKLFKGSEASVEVAYDNEHGWSVKGELEIAKDSVKGIESGHITVSYANGILDAVGTAKPKLKGVEEVRLHIRFEEDTSEIEGSVKIAKMTGIKEGSGKLKIVKIGDVYDFSGSGTVVPDIPNVSTALSFEFHNDIFLVDAKVGFEKDRLKGTLNVGITNRAVDPEGKPTGEALPDYKVFGSSELQLIVTDNIVVTAGVRLLENGEIEVKGGIKLPQKIELVPILYSIFNKPIIEIPKIHIPLFGIPLGVTTLGIEAVIAPRLTATVQIGPGSLTNVQAEITYNPSHPDDMTITGGADFEFIARAIINAGVDFGISASIAIASLTGGINLSAYLMASAKQPVFHADIKYSPKTGFELSGDVQAIVKAILGFSGNLYAEASIGVWPLDYTKRWEKELFKKEIDTGLDIGFKFPFAYKNGKADVSWENLQFVYPTMEDVTQKVKEQIVNPIADSF